MSFIDTGRRFTYGVKTLLSDVSSISGAVAGDTVFCSENNRMMTFDGAFWMCNDFIKLNNASGVTLVQGDLVVSSLILSGYALRTTAANSAVVIGPVVFGNTDNNPIIIAISGIYKVNTNSSTDAGDYAFTSTTAGQAASTTTMGAGFFGIFVEQKAAAGLTKCLLRPHTEFF